ncbi:MAG: hypothetical protein GY941_20970 [Planctomycetes bacterium]|nr:hypothetical protein [Planctomycetota bacterium]
MPDQIPPAEINKAIKYLKEIYHLDITSSDLIHAVKNVHTMLIEMGHNCTQVGISHEVERIYTKLLMVKLRE